MNMWSVIREGDLSGWRRVVRQVGTMPDGVPIIQTLMVATDADITIPDEVEVFLRRTEWPHTAPEGMAEDSMRLLDDVPRMLAVLRDLSEGAPAPPDLDDRVSVIVSRDLILAARAVLRATAGE